jgi:hypothetical protein
MHTIDIPGPFTYRDLPRLGISRRRLRGLLSDGVVRRVVRGAYAPVALGDGLELRVRAIGLVLARGQVVCDRTAAWLHGIDMYTYAEHDLGLVVETCGPPRGAAVQRAGVDGHRRTLREDEVMDLHGVAVTTPIRTALDLACILERRDAMAALDAFRFVHELDLRSLTVTLRERYRGRRGVVQARALVPHSDPRAESVRESWVRIEIIDAGLPVPEPQVWVEVAGVPTYRIDLAYRRKRVAVEYNGFDAHESGREQIEATAERRQWLQEHGWTVIVVRNGDFSPPGLDRWIGELRRALRPSYTNRRKLERGPRPTE